MPGHGRSIRRLAPSFAAAATTYAAATVLGWPASAMPADTVDAPTPCWSDQIAVSASPTEGAVGHRAVTLIFTLAGGAEPCTIAGYAGVDSGAGGPLVHARPTPRGYLGGLPAGVNVAPAVILSISTQGQAIVEGIAVDGEGKPCPTYTDLLVNPPGTTNVVTVSATIEACELQVHPVTAV
ncbi:MULTISPECIES: DUF4232 domain-containing protein [Mycobacterium]|uniref:DUF4232 domain-containing protein n=1 Tax=Mycobacterium TaxID=1763 RepID=UPI0014792EBB|nr:MULTISPECIES: DUF4232 domain-containing protein [Mycobacterium]MCA2274669.1 DUF4232 domain-containing protein [Mycobacterium intracellulare]MCA2324401.1 DUF4232 domain-containing protein [Mycobacterium intracellulare]UEB24482.1 DUF4232 domain-containing protein [Mycobacterium intracellulare]UGU01757.1 DUF4232 domain-containing protein [Mycobacterium intracellulare]UQB92818.1 DUF4232 domain-containing protein [Mycobacterium intracellulare]